MSDAAPTPNQQVVPRPVRPLDERASSFTGTWACRKGSSLAGMTELPKAYTPREVEGPI
jgi:hypothetical protein